MKIYTKVGDGGQTGLFSGQKVWKNDPRIEATGAMDETNSALGLALSFLKDKKFRTAIEEVQKELFILGADISTPAGAKTSKPAPRITPAHAARLEKEIDALQAGLPALATFILPGGSPAGAALHVARSFCRRAERALIPLLQDKGIDPAALVYINRLSDHLFVLARAVNQQENFQETPWLP